MPRNPLVVLVLLAASVTTASAQLPPRVSGNAEITLLTVTPGDELYSLFGHSALRVHDGGTGLDVVFNYGTFDFTRPWFVPKFVYGALDYELSASSMAALLYGAQAERRGVVEHRLSLDSVQVAGLWSALVENYVPENRTYRYDFVFDNCSTRIRDLLARTVGPGWVHTGADERTLRDLLRPYVAHRPWIRTGIDLLLGSVTDRPATAEERMFLPDGLDAALLAAAGPSGEPLVVRTDTLLHFPGRSAGSGAFPWPSVLAGLLLAGALFSSRARPASRARVTVIDVTCLAALGIVGIVLWFLSFFSLHAAMSDNFNALWALPLHLPAAILGRRLEGRLGATWFALTALLAAAWFVCILAGIQAAVPAIMLLVGAVLVRSAVLAVSLRPAPRQAPVVPD